MLGWVHQSHVLVISAYAYHFVFAFFLQVVAMPASISKLRSLSQVTLHIVRRQVLGIRMVYHALHHHWRTLELLLSVLASHFLLHFSHSHSSSRCPNIVSPAVVLNGTSRVEHCLTDSSGPAVPRLASQRLEGLPLVATLLSLFWQNWLGNWLLVDVVREIGCWDSCCATSCGGGRGVDKGLQFL